jgi:hypothetical protein
MITPDLHRLWWCLRQIEEYPKGGTDKTDSLLQLVNHVLDSLTNLVVAQLRIASPWWHCT